MLRHGTPRLKTLEKYADPNSATGATAHIGYMLRTAPDWDYLQALRDEWDGTLIVKGDKLDIRFDKAGQKKVVAKFIVSADQAGDVPF